MPAFPPDTQTRTARLSPRATAILAAHQYQGPTNDCGPFSAAILVNALRGANLDGATLGREMTHPRRQGIVPVIRRLPGHATFPWGLVDVLRQHGLRASWRMLVRPDQLLTALEHGRIPVPILGAWRPAWAHYSILVAHDPERGWGFADSAYQRGGVVWRPADVFREQWRAFGRTAVEVDPAG